MMPALGSPRAHRSLAVVFSLLIEFLVLSAPVFAQAQSGIISGMVRNSDGTPAAGVPIGASVDGGNVIPSFGPQTRTDRSGRFRINLAPGRYRVVAGLLEYSPTYYPGTTNVSEATVLSLGAGATLDNVDITLTLPSAFRISGKVRRPAGARADAPMVTKVGLHDANVFIAVSHGTVPFLFETTAASDGSFEFLGIPQGKYKLSTEPVITNWTPPVFVVSDSDVTGLDLVVPLESRVNVRVTVDSNIPLPAFSIAFTGQYGGREPQPQYMTPPPPPGGFPSHTLTTALPAGDHAVVLSGLPASYVVKSISSGSRDLLKEPLAVDGINPLEIVVTFAMRAGTGAKVAGSVILPPGLSVSPSQRVSLYAPRSITSLDVPLNPDGTFEFVKVPPGNYEVTLYGAAALLYQPATVSVLDKDVAGADIVVPRQIKLRGKVIVEGGGPLPRPRLETNRPNLNTGPTVLDDGTFEITLPEGEYRFGVRELPEPYYAKSATYGTVDVLGQPLRLGSTPDAEVLVTLATRVPAPWRKVSGRVSGIWDSTPPSVHLSGNRATLHTAVRPDGSFEFSEVLPGTYRASSGTFMLPQPTVTVSDRDVTGVELIYRPLAPFRGRMVVEGGGPAASFQIGYAGPNFTPEARTLIDLEENGTFTVVLPEDEIRLSVLSPHASYTLKSITYGGADVLRGAAKFSAADRQEIIVTVGTALPPPWRKVSGRVVANSGLKATRVTMTASFGIQYKTAVAADGTFEFSKVLPGTYNYLQTDTYFALSENTIRVTDNDITGLEISHPPVFDVSGRAVMADGSALPDNRRLFIGSVPLRRDFKLLVRGGEQRISFTGFGHGYRIHAATYGTVDLLNEPLRLSAPATGEILVTVAAEAPPPRPGITVRGRLTGAISSMPEPRRVRIYNDDLAPNLYAEADVSADGAFEFVNVPPGHHVLQPVGVDHAAMVVARGTFRDRDVAGLTITVFRSRRVPVRVVMEDGRPLPQWSLPYLYSTRDTEPLGMEIPADGQFSWTVSEDKQFLSLRRLPADYFVKSMMYGTIDLLKSPLKLDDGAAPAEIVITIGRSLIP